MEEIVAALASLRESLKCGYCNKLVRDGSLFLKCSHLFCSKHITGGQLNCCFVCHEGTLKDVVKASAVMEMIKDYEALELIFKGKENEPEKNAEISVEKNDKKNIPARSDVPNQDNIMEVPGGSKISLRRGRNKITPEPLKEVITKQTITRGRKNTRSRSDVEDTVEPTGRDLKLDIPTKTKPLTPSKSNTTSPSKMKQPILSVSNKEPGRVLRGKAKKGESANSSIDEILPAPSTTKILKTSPLMTDEPRAMRRMASKSPQERTVASKVLPRPSKSPQERTVVSKALPRSSKSPQERTAPSKALPPSISSSKVKAGPDTKIMKKNNPQQSCDDSFSDISSNYAKKNLTKRNNKGETPLHSACVRGKFEVVSALLAAGADPNTRDHAGWTPLHEAAGAGRVELARALLAHGALPSPPGPHYITPLHEAVRVCLPDMITLLLQGGALLDARDDKGNTPLQLANEETKKLLQLLQSSEDTLEVNRRLTRSVVLYLYPSNLMKEHMAKLQNLAKYHEDLKIETDYSKNVTHLLVEECRVNQDTLRAVAGGRGILTIEWLNKCDHTTLADPENFEMKSFGGDIECIELSIINKNNLRPGLFDGCHFYFLGFSSNYEISAHLTVKKAFLCKLVEEAGGVVLKREPNPEAISQAEKKVPYHAPLQGPLQNCAHFIIYQTRPLLAYNMEHLRSLPVGWLIQCIEAFKLVDPS